MRICKMQSVTETNIYIASVLQFSPISEVQKINKYIIGVDQL